MSILEVSNVSKSFGGVKANVDISMNVEKGKIVGLIPAVGSSSSSISGSFINAIASSNNFCCPKDRSPALSFLF